MKLGEEEEARNAVTKLKSKPRNTARTQEKVQPQLTLPTPDSEEADISQTIPAAAASRPIESPGRKRKNS